tara:strand:+ start:44 stop:358 length:315 start_codon:yes stop_codon:yes gene_type:complete
MLKSTWSKLFSDFNEAKMIVLEWDSERREVYESAKVWDDIINYLYEIERMNISDDDKIQKVLRYCNIKMLFPLSEAVRRDRLVKYISSTRDKILYYQNNPEEEE